MPAHDERVRKNYPYEWWKPWWQRESSCGKMMLGIIALAFVLYFLTFILAGLS